MTPNIVCMYFTPLRHTGLTLSFDEPLTIDEQRFLSEIDRRLGSNVVSQTHYYSIAELICQSNMKECGIGAGIEERKSDSGFKEDPKFPAWTLHFGGDFSSKCTAYKDPKLPNCAPRGRELDIFLSFYFVSFCT